MTGYKNLYEFAANLGAAIGSLYKGNSRDRVPLLEFMDANDWFGMAYAMKDRIPLILENDIPIFQESLTLWLSAYRKPGREKITLMLKRFEPTYPEVCQLYSRFIKDSKLSDDPSAWKLLDSLLSEMDKDISRYDENDVEYLIGRIESSATRTAARLFSGFLNTAKRDGKPLSQWKYTFDSRENAMLMAKNIFADYKQRGIIINGNFEDMSWTLSNEARTVGLTLLTFDGGVKKMAMSWIGCTYSQFITSVKAYIVLNLGEMSLATLQDLTRFFNRLAVTKSEDVTDLIEYGRHIVYLLQLIPGGNERRDAVIEDLEERLEQRATHRKDGKQRQLADFNSYLRFHEILSRFWRNADERQRLFYFPLYFWWNLTAVLPLRPMEFLLMPRDCLHFNNGEPIITVRRTKLKGGNEKIGYRINDDYTPHEYTINEPLADELQQYLVNTQHMHQTELNTLFIPEPHFKYLGGKGNARNRYYTYANLGTCKRYFYKEVVDTQNTVISEVRLGDTRHLAMTSLILSGGSPVICRELACHANIEISSHYYSNASNLVECLTIDKFRKIKSKEATLDGKARYAVSMPSDARRVDEGLCTSAVFKDGGMEDCLKVTGINGHIGDCRRCQCFIPDNPGIMVEFNDDKAAKEQLDADSRYLIRMIELARKGLGHTEDIGAALLRLQLSGDHYGKCLWEKYSKEGVR